MSSFQLPGAGGSESAAPLHCPGPRQIAQLLPSDTHRLMALSNYVYRGGNWVVSWRAEFRGPFIQATRPEPRPLPLDFEGKCDE